MLDYQYTHDSNGNVLTISGINKPSLSPGTTDYTHEVGNRLTQSTGAEVKTYSYDSHGNIVSDGTKTFVYNQNNRLVQVKQGETVLSEYFYDAFGRRVKKTVSENQVVYHYDIAGNLIAETTSGGTPSRDIVYLNGERAAMKVYDYQAGWYFFVNDHLGTPQKIVNEAGEVVWAGFYQPFGKSWAYPADITNNFRLPGQYYDAETGLHYNWHRYYDPDTGRYITADPIGLEGGINLYAYVRGNPVIFADPTALVLVSFSMESANAIAELIKNSPTARELIIKLDKSPEVIAIFTINEEHLIHDFLWGINHYDPDLNAAVFDPCKHSGSDGKSRPPEIGLAHELIHALHDILGTYSRDSKIENDLTIGLSGNEKITENKIRDDYKKSGYDIDIREQY